MYLFVKPSLSNGINMYYNAMHDMILIRNVAYRSYDSKRDVDIKYSFDDDDLLDYLLDNGCTEDQVRVVLEQMVEGENGIQIHSNGEVEQVEWMEEGNYYLFIMANPCGELCHFVFNHKGIHLRKGHHLVCVECKEELEEEMSGRGYTKEQVFDVWEDYIEWWWSQREEEKKDSSW